MLVQQVAILMLMDFLFVEEEFIQILKKIMDNMIYQKKFFGQVAPVSLFAVNYFGVKMDLMIPFSHTKKK